MSRIALILIAILLQGCLSHSVDNIVDWWSNRLKNTLSASDQSLFKGVADDLYISVP
jgi:hypothetical protein